MFHRAAVTSSLSWCSSCPCRCAAAGPRQIPDKYKWDLTPIYPSDAAWRAAKDGLRRDLRDRSSRARLAVPRRPLQMRSNGCPTLRKTLYRMSTYANLQADQDTRHAEHQGMRQEVTLLGYVVRHRGRFIEPEILQIGATSCSSSSPRSRALRRTASTLTRFFAPRPTRSARRRRRSSRGRTRHGGAVNDLGAAPECRVSISDVALSDGRP